MELKIILFRFSIALLLSSFFGIERQVSKKPIGFGTYIFVTIGSCALGMAALTIEPSNPLPLLGAIVTGIGFLGAGALIKTTDKIFGFTSAASIWIFAIIGLLFGVGEYALGFSTYIIVLIIISIDKFLEIKGIGSYQRKITINTKKIVDKSEILTMLKDTKWRLESLSVDNTTKKSSMKYLVSMPRENVNKLKENFSKKDFIESFEIE